MAKSAEEILMDVSAEALVTLLAGRYSPVRAMVLPQAGAFSLVMEARDGHTGQDVVLKILEPGAAPYRTVSR
jgi:hypothetical protein